MSIDPARQQAQLRALDPDAPRKRPPARSCSGCRRRTRDPSGTCPRCQAVEESQVVERLSVDELHRIVAAARAELARRAALISQTLSAQ
jgi:uncharacterized paraquat-inducible protein A